MVLDIKDGYTLCILGCGVMGSAVLNAVISNVESARQSGTKAPLPGKYVATVKGQESVDIVKKQFAAAVEAGSLTVYDGDNDSALAVADVVLLSCKPFMTEAILKSIKPELLEGRLIMSLVAGKTLEQLNSLTNNLPLICRVMTNTPAKISEGMAVVSFPPVEVSDSAKECVMWIFNQTGRCIIMDEKHMDAFTSLVGSGPAFCMMMMEAMIDGGIRMGIPYNVARECAAQVMAGTGKLVLEGNEHPAALRANVCTPGGTTIGGLLVMEDGKVRSAVARAVEEAANIATSLGKK